MTAPNGEILTRDEWEVRIKMESAGRVWMVHRATGDIFPGAYLPEAGFFFVGKHGVTMLPSDRSFESDPEFTVVMGPRLKNEPLSKDVHEAIMHCLPEGVTPRPFSR